VTRKVFYFLAHASPFSLEELADILAREGMPWERDIDLGGPLKPRFFVWVDGRPVLWLWWGEALRFAFEVHRLTGAKCLLTLSQRGRS
jgi:hypothetical protein